MRVCHVIESCGGSGQVVLDLIEAGIKAGDDVTLIYSPLRAETYFTGALKKLEKRGKFYPLPMERKVGLDDIRAFVKLFTRLRKHGPFDILHSHSSKAGALTRLAARLLPRAPQIYTPHAFITMAPGASPVYGWIERRLSSLAEAIICVSQQEYRHAADYLRIPKRKLHVIPNGIRLDYPATREEARAQTGFGDQDYVIGFVGRLVAQKNPQRLAEAFAGAAKEDPRLKLAIIGDGPLRMDIESMLAAHRLSDRVRFLGERRGRDFMPGFDCLLCSSDYESFGLVILEAMAAGLPVVTTPVGIAEDAVLDGVTGFVVADFASASLAQAVIKLAQLGTEARTRMAVETQKQAKHFSIESMAEKTRTLYKKLLESPKS